MKTVVYAFLVLLCLVCGCTNDKKSACDGKQIQSLENRNNTKDDFVDFIEKFSSDSCFQKEHISFPFKFSNIYMGDDDKEKTTVSYINENEWLYNNICDTVIGSSEVTVKVNKKKYIVEVRGKECGIIIDFLFKKVDDTWFMYEAVDSSM